MVRLYVVVAAASRSTNSSLGGIDGQREGNMDKQLRRLCPAERGAKAQM
ncbi:MAG: hypothetical protein RLZZ216_997 [Cyanobacteriota bacterium]|jgi:hypothetical protein